MLNRVIDSIQTLLWILASFLLGLSVGMGNLEAATNCNRNPIYCQIVKNHPTINRKYAYNLSNIIHKKVRGVNLAPHILK